MEEKAKRKGHGTEDPKSLAEEDKPTLRDYKSEEGQAAKTPAGAKGKAKRS